MKLHEITERLHDDSMVVYHGSDERFDSFDPDRVTSASGSDKGGWGFYFSTSEEVASQYASGSGEVRAYRISRGKYFDFSDMLSNEFGEELIDELEALDVDESELDQFRSDFLSDDYIHDTTNEQVYDWLGHVLGSRKDASMFLKRMGYKGTTYKDKTDPDARNFVVFDPRDIKAA